VLESGFKTYTKAGVLAKIFRDEILTLRDRGFETRPRLERADT